MRKPRLLASLLCAVLMVGVLTVPAYAGGGDESEDGVGEYIPWEGLEPAVMISCCKYFLITVKLRVSCVVPIITYYHGAHNLSAEMSHIRIVCQLQSQSRTTRVVDKEYSSEHGGVNFHSTQQGHNNWREHPSNNWSHKVLVMMRGPPAAPRSEERRVGKECRY